MPTGPNPLVGWEFDPAAVRTVGAGLQRPECILAERDGTLWTADARGGVVRIRPDGTQDLVAARPSAHFDTERDMAGSLLSGTLPNGLAFAEDGDILVANFGTDALEVMDREGRVRTLHDTIDGHPLGKVNFVLRDRRGRIWITVSTMLDPWSDAIGRHVADGYVAVLDGHGLRVVADGFAFTNEIRFDAEERWLYVAETTAKRVTRMRIADDASVLEREVFGPGSLGAGLVDGITFDAYGNLWATMIFADRLVALTPDGDLLELFCDGDPEATARFEEAFAAGGPVPFETLARTGGTLAPWLASVTFGGPDLDRVHLGSLRGSTVPVFPSPVPGLPPIHW
ncbi:SMP-30/gluconolactonase/LRE family protein [Actinomycetospora rhizophila]|uniref:SMP-30/gluconolactonase/LRE family protein n=1 Tax=Actinomycetospora rhizophila TaxID=1416876 RepID=A0ABV9ZG36_9PSEU